MNKYKVFGLSVVLTTLLAVSVDAEETPAVDAATPASDAVPASAVEAAPTTAGETAPAAAGETTPATAGEAMPAATDEAAPATVVETAPAANTGNAAAGAGELAQRCTGCHGADGNSDNGAIPSIAGISPDYFKFALEAYRNGGRRSAVMQGLIAGLSAPEVDALASYFARQAFAARSQNIDSAQAEQGGKLHQRYCVKCHGLAGDADEYGLLAGQWSPYLRQVLQEYQAGARAAIPMMHTKLQRLQAEVGEAGIEQLVQYYASRTAAGR